MTPNTPRYRVTNIPLTEEQFFTLRRFLPHGMKARIFRFIVSDLIEELEKDAGAFLAGIYTREIKLKDFMKGATGDRLIHTKEDRIPDDDGRTSGGSD